jgi:hypothetical protein
MSGENIESNKAQVIVSSENSEYHKIQYNHAWLLAWLMSLLGNWTCHPSCYSETEH